MSDIESLEYFLSYELQSADKLFALFAQLDGAKIFQGKERGERFLFKTGAREDRLTLIAHADTVYDGKQKECINQELVRKGDFLHGKNPDFGIGADDRAGCAILWLMRDSGHNILLLDGEEQSYRGARYLVSEQKNILDELYSSRFAVEFDLPCKDELSYHETLAPNPFRKYIEQKTGYRENPITYPTDIWVLCKNMCAVNLSVGYFNQHTPFESIDIKAWLKTLNIIRQISLEQIPKFSSH